MPQFLEPRDWCQGSPGLKYQRGGFGLWARHDTRSGRHSGHDLPTVEVGEDRRPIRRELHIPILWLFCHLCQLPSDRVTDTHYNVPETSRS